MQTFKTKKLQSNKTKPGGVMQRTLVIFLMLPILLFAKTSFTKEAKRSDHERFNHFVKLSRCPSSSADCCSRRSVVDAVSTVPQLSYSQGRCLRFRHRSARARRLSSTALAAQAISTVPPFVLPRPWLCSCQCSVPYSAGIVQILTFLR